MDRVQPPAGRGQAVGLQPLGPGLDSVPGQVQPAGQGDGGGPRVGVQGQQDPGAGAVDLSQSAHSLP
jgi:hypothetical protein